MNTSKLSGWFNHFGMPITLIAFGLILLFSPDTASILISKLVGWLLVAAGIVYGIYTFLSWPAKRISQILSCVILLGLGSVLLTHPLLLAENIGRFLGILLSIEGGQCLRNQRKLMAIVLWIAALTLILAPMTASRLVFSLCGLAVLAMGVFMFLDRLKHREYLDEPDDPNIIDAL